MGRSRRIFRRQSRKWVRRESSAACISHSGEPRLSVPKPLQEKASSAAVREHPHWSGFLRDLRMGIAQRKGIFFRRGLRFLNAHP